MANSIEQYRAAIVFFKQFSKLYSTFKLCVILITNAAICIRNNAVLINFCLQFFIFILMISGDIEVYPGPNTDNVLDIVHLNIRNIRHTIAYLNTLVHEFKIY